jgi:hypothetical protein
VGLICWRACRPSLLATRAPPCAGADAALLQLRTWCGGVARACARARRLLCVRRIVLLVLLLPRAVLLGPRPHGCHMAVAWLSHGPWSHGSIARFQE